MLPYENVYSLENGRLIKNTENKIEYLDKNGQGRVKTNPSYEDFKEVGKYPLKEDTSLEKPTQGEVFYVIEGDYIVAKVKEG